MIEIESSGSRIDAAKETIAAKRAARSASGAVSELSKNVSAMNNGVLSAFLTLATGGSKLEAAFNGVKDAVLEKVLGPMGMVVGMSVTMLSAIKGLARGFAEMGMSGAGGLETIRNQFRILLQGMESARQKAAQMRQFSDVSPFKFADVAEGTRALQSLTRGALAGKAGMDLVGDAASVAGTNFQEMAVHVGRAHDALSSGRPAGEAMARMQELGVITGQTRTAIEGMQQSGASFSEMWRVLENDLKRSGGAMAAISVTLEGLQSTLEDTESTMASGFSEGFLEGEKEAVRAMTEALGKLTPVTDYFGRMLGQLAGVEDKTKAKMLDMVTSLPGFEQGMKLAGGAVVALNAALVSMAGIKGVGFIFSRLMGGSKGDLAGAKTAMEGAGKSLSEAFTFALDRKGGAAWGSIKKGAAGAAGAIRTAGIGGAVTAIGKCFNLLGSAVKATFAMLGGWPVAALAVAGAAIYQIYDDWRQAKEALVSYGRATSETIARLQAQAAAIQTADDLSRAYASNLSELAQAHRDAGKAATEGNAKMLALSQEKIKKLGEERAALDKVQRSALARDDAYYERRTDQRADARDVKEARGSGQQDLMGSEARLADLKAQRNEIEATTRSAKMLLDGLEDLKLRQREASDSARKSETDYNALGEQMAVLQRQAEQYRPQVVTTMPGGPGGGSQTITYGDPEKYRETQEAIAALQVQMDKMADSSESAAMAIALSSGNELAILEEKVKLYREHDALVQSVAKAQAELNNLASDDKDEKAIEKRKAAEVELQKLIDARAKKERLAAGAGVTLGTAGSGAVAEMDARAKELKALASEKEKNLRLAEQDKAIAQAILEVERQRRTLALDTAERVAAAQDNAYQAELDRFEIARKRRALEREEAERKAGMIRAQGQRDALELYAQGRLPEAMGVMKKAGDSAHATIEQARNEEAAGNKADDAAKKAFERDAGRQREKMLANEQAAQKERSAMVMRNAGDLTGAQQQEEEAAALRDAAERPMLKRQFEDQGFKEEADTMVNNELEDRKKRRALQQKEELRGATEARAATDAGLGAEDLRKKAMEAEIQGHLDYAEALREAAQRTEENATKEARIVEMSRREGITREEATKKVGQADATARGQRAVEMQDRARQRALGKQGLVAENKARRTEMTGHEERAARIRDEQARKEREVALRAMGLDPKQASRQAKREQRDARSARRRGNGMSYEGPPPFNASDWTAKKTHSLQRVGGGGGAYGAGSAALFNRMDKMLQHLAVISGRSGQQAAPQRVMQR